MKVMVEKKGGRLQAFALSKIMRTIAAAGAGAKLMQEVTSDVVKEILSDVERGSETLVIPSQKIRKVIARTLSKKNRRIASSYENFGKDKPKR